DGGKMAEMIQSDLAKIGVTADIYTVDWAQYVKTSADKMRNGAVEFGWTGTNGDPDNFFSPLLGCDQVGAANRANWCNPDFNALVQKAQATSDAAQRATLYMQAQAIFKDQAPWLPIAHAVSTVVTSARVTGFRIDSLGRMNFEGVDVAG